MKTAKNRYSGAMKKFTVLALLTMALLTGVARAGEENWTKCAGWNLSSTQIKLAYVEGWGSALSTSDYIASGGDAGSRLLRDKLWPKGMNAAAFVVEINRWCELPGNSNRDVVEIILYILRQAK